MSSDDIGCRADENQTGALLFLLVYDQKPYNDLVPYKKSTIMKYSWLHGSLIIAIGLLSVSI